MVHLRLRRILTIAVAAAILALSLIPKPPPIPGGFHSADKVLHLVAYLVLSFLVFASFFEERRIGNRLITVPIVAGLCLLFGGLIEFLQIFTHRQPELWDLIADFIGALCGAAIGAGISRGIRAKAQ